MKPVLVLHGGAGSKLQDRNLYNHYVDSLRSMLEPIYTRMQKGLSAIDAVTEANVLLEDDPLYNAGRGSKLQKDGKIRMSASIMDGFSRRFGGCVNVEGVKNPIRLAHALMSCDDRVLAAQGARQYAKEIKLEFASSYTPARRAEFAKHKSGKMGTVGALALDQKGRLAAATSTGGRGYEYPHRVSDSPTTAGNFANQLGAVSATGVGEQIIEFSTASTICAYMEVGLSLHQAVRSLISKAKRRQAQFGLIALDKKGDYVASTTTTCLIWAAISPNGFEFFKPK